MLLVVLRDQSGARERSAAKRRRRTRREDQEGGKGDQGTPKHAETARREE